MSSPVQDMGIYWEAVAVLQTRHVAWLEDLTMLTDLEPVQEEFGRPWLLRWHHPRRGG
jgi:hypothetical protein